MQTNTVKNDISNFITKTLEYIIEYHSIDIELRYKIVSKIIFIDDEHYGEEIHKIDPNAGYTDEEKNKGFGKTIYKEGKNYVIINSQILVCLIKSEFKNIICKYLIYHELGHCVNNIINPLMHPKEKPKHSIPIKELSEYLFTVAIDEYMANNYISFLLSSDDCKALLEGIALFKDIEKLYTNIFEPFELFHRIWNKSDAIIKYLFQLIPLFEKSGDIKKIEDLELLNTKPIIEMLKMPIERYDEIFFYLVASFNNIVRDYNSDNPTILQKLIQ